MPAIVADSSPSVRLFGCYQPRPSHRPGPSTSIEWATGRFQVEVHALLIQDGYDSDLLGIFADPEVGKAAGDRQFRTLLRKRWLSDGRRGQMRPLGSAGAYLWLRPFDVDGAR
jgi:hypothetical protein